MVEVSYCTWNHQVHRVKLFDKVLEPFAGHPALGTGDPEKIQRVAVIIL